MTNIKKMWLVRTLLASMSVWLLASAVNGTDGFAQSSSLFHRADANPASLAVRPSVVEEQRKSVEAETSYFAVKPLPKRIFKVGDLVTVIYRQKMEYNYNGKTDNKRDAYYQFALADWMRIHNGKLIPDTMPAGDPSVDLGTRSGFKGEGKKYRTNEVVTRVTCKVIDIMPNSCLVLQGGPDVVETDNEKLTVTFTGTCRTEDILADNTVLSTQILEAHLKSENSGAVRDTMNRGWANKLWDIVKPF
jgi:flagellar L-ring protein FlgH